MKMSVEELKVRIWEELGLNDRSIIFCYFDTEYGDGIGGDLIESMDDLFDCDEWYEFCYNEVPNVPSISVNECVSYLIGNGEVDHIYGGDIDFINAIMTQNPENFFRVLYENSDVLATIWNQEAPNPAYDVLEDEDDE